MAKAEGRVFEYSTDESLIRSDLLEVFDFESKDQYIQTVTREFGAVCPFSGLPDTATVILEYYPQGGTCIELKSLKYYLTSFRNIGIYQEGVTKRIWGDLSRVLASTNLRVTTKYLTRGGFDTICVEGMIDPDTPITAMVD